MVGRTLPALTAFLILGAGCRRIDSGRGGGGSRTVLDVQGNRVALPGEVRRILSNGNSLNQLFLTLGASGRMVATVPEVRSNPWFVRLSPTVGKLPTPFASQGGIDVEAVLALHPDLVVLWNDDASAARLRSLDIPVLIVHFTTPEEFRHAVMVLGMALGGDAPARANRFCHLYDSLRAVADRRLLGIPESERVGVYYSADGPLSTEGTGSIVSSWIAEAGGVNVAARGGVRGSRTAVTPEQLLAWDPQVILTREAADRDRFLSEPRWKCLSAVRAGRIYAVPRGVNAWSTRNGESSLQPLWAARTLHPERFADVFVEPAVRDFYREFYGYGISDAELSEVMAGKVPQSFGKAP